MELIGEGCSVEELKESQDNSKLAQYAGKSFRCKVNVVNKSITNRELVKIIEKLDLRALEPHVIDLKNPELTLSLLFDHQRDLVMFGR